MPVEPSRPVLPHSLSRPLPVVLAVAALGFAPPSAAFAQPAPAGRGAPPAEGNRFEARAMVGLGYADTQSRQDDSTAFFAQAGAALSVGYAPWRQGDFRIVVSGELLLSRSLQSSPASRAAGNLLGGGPTLTLGADQVGEVGVGVLVVNRAREAQDLGLTGSNVNLSPQVFLSRHWPVAEHLLLGLTLKFAFLPTRETRDENGGTIVQYAEGIGLLALGVALR